MKQAKHVAIDVIILRTFRRVLRCLMCIPVSKLVTVSILACNVSVALAVNEFLSGKWTLTFLRSHSKNFRWMYVLPYIFSELCMCRGEPFLSDR